MKTVLCQWLSCDSWSDNPIAWHLTAVYQWNLLKNAVCQWLSYDNCRCMSTLSYDNCCISTVSYDKWGMPLVSHENFDMSMVILWQLKCQRYCMTIDCRISMESYDKCGMSTLSHDNWIISTVIFDNCIMLTVQYCIIWQLRYVNDSTDISKPKKTTGHLKITSNCFLEKD